MQLFRKYEGNPVFGSTKLGTAFDAYVWKDNGRFRMDFSWRKKKCTAVTFSTDGIHWEEPQPTLAPNPASGFEDDINRNCVLRVGNIYKMWYTGQARGHSYIGYAESTDGLHFDRRCTEPVLISEYPYEGMSVMNPCVLFEDGRYRMWYSAGETYEPNVIAYAESEDGIAWRKRRANPIFVRDGSHTFEQDRIGGCQVMKTNDMGYVMFYIGYRDIDTACICIARSDDGIVGWERSVHNPLVSPNPDGFDADACYKPTAVFDDARGMWMLWYNGRKGKDEYIGLAEYAGRNLFGR